MEGGTGGLGWIASSVHDQPAAAQVQVLVPSVEGATAPAAAVVPSVIRQPGAPSAIASGTPVPEEPRETVEVGAALPQPRRRRTRTR